MSNLSMMKLGVFTNSFVAYILNNSKKELEEKAVNEVEIDLSIEEYLNLKTTNPISSYFKLSDYFSCALDEEVEKTLLKAMCQVDLFRIKQIKNLGNIVFENKDNVNVIGQKANDYLETLKQNNANELISVSIENRQKTTISRYYQLRSKVLINDISFNEEYNILENPEETVIHNGKVDIKDYRKLYESLILLDRDIIISDFKGLGYVDDDKKLVLFTCNKLNLSKKMNFAKLSLNRLPAKFLYIPKGQMFGYLNGVAGCEIKETTYEEYVSKFD